MTRGQVAALLNINPETLRYYEKLELIKPLINKDNGYRYYDDLLVSKLELIVSFKKLGFTLKEIRDFFDLIATSDKNPNKFSQYIDIKVEQIDDQISSLIGIKESLLKFRNKEDKTTCSLFSKFIT